MDIAINEIYGPVFQGEGLDIGRPCAFIRLQHCPVKCPGCDTAYTWNGTEQGTKLRVLDGEAVSSVQARLDRILESLPRCGIVVSGGEPLIYYKHVEFKQLLRHYRGRWIGLETSGFCGTSPLDLDHLRSFLACFTSVHISPKITPCLHGEGWTDEELCINLKDILNGVYASRNALKFVCRDQADLDKVDWFFDHYKEWRGTPTYLMPYGQEPEEIKRTSEFLLPYCARYGYILSPRLQSLFYGKTRGV